MAAKDNPRRPARPPKLPATRLEWFDWKVPTTFRHSKRGNERPLIP